MDVNCEFLDDKHAWTTVLDGGFRRDGSFFEPPTTRRYLNSVLGRGPYHTVTRAGLAYPQPTPKLDSEEPQLRQQSWMGTTRLYYLTNDGKHYALTSTSAKPGELLETVDSTPMRLRLSYDILDTCASAVSTGIHVQPSGKRVYLSLIHI